MTLVQKISYLKICIKTKSITTKYKFLHNSSKIQIIKSTLNGIRFLNTRGLLGAWYKVRDPMISMGKDLYRLPNAI